MLERMRAMGRAVQRPRRRTAHARGRMARPHGLLAIAVGALISMSAPSLAAAHDPDWNQVDNIKEAAARLAQLQRTQGATKAFIFIDACYRTHSLSSEYTRAFEACIAQDYLETQILALVYSRVTPDVLKRMNVPTPQVLAETMSRRVGAAFAQYKIPKERIVEFKRNVDEHGFPLFFKALFPDAKPPAPNPSTEPAPSVPGVSPENPEKK